MAGTFSRSWTLLKESFAVLKDNAGLIVFPVISGICTLIVSAAFFVPGFLLFGSSGESESVNPLIYVLLFLFYLVSYTVIIFFNAALIFCVRNILHGQPTTFSEGMGMAWRNIGKIVGWAAVSATVGMVLLRHPGERRMGGRAPLRAGRHGLEPAHLLRRAGPGLRGAGAHRGHQALGQHLQADLGRERGRAVLHRAPSSACCPSWG